MIGSELNDDDLVLPAPSKVRKSMCVKLFLA
jgi:hypothetical protein